MKPTHKAAYLSAIDKQQLQSLLLVNECDILDKTLCLVMRNALHSASNQQQLADNLREAIASLEVAVLKVEMFTGARQ